MRHRQVHREVYSPLRQFMLGSRDHLLIFLIMKKLVCVYCKGNHSPSVCDIVSDVQKRLEIVKRVNLCFTCLGNHKVSLCNFKFLCRNCKHKHTIPACVGLSVKLNKVIRETVTRMVQPRQHRPIHQHKPA